MTSQPNHETGRKTPRVTLTEHGLTIDAAATIAAAYAAFAVAGSYALAALFASSPDMDCSIDPPAPVGERVRVGRRLESLAPSHIVAAATGLGYEAGIQRVWADHVGATFASAPRLIEALRVGSSFTYTRTTRSRPGTGAILSRGEVAAGDYLIFSVGLGTPQVQAVARGEQIPNADDLTAVPGFAADRISATCGLCRARWTASGGRAVFAPVGPRGHAWDLGQARDIGLVTGTVACPSPGCAGRVHFTTAGDRA